MPRLERGGWLLHLAARWSASSIRRTGLLQRMRWRAESARKLEAPKSLCWPTFLSPSCGDNLRPSRNLSDVAGLEQVELLREAETPRAHPPAYPSTNTICVGGAGSSPGCHANATAAGPVAGPTVRRGLAGLRRDPGGGLPRVVIGVRPFPRTKVYPTVVEASETRGAIRVASTGLPLPAPHIRHI